MQQTIDVHQELAQALARAEAALLALNARDLSSLMAEVHRCIPASPGEIAVCDLQDAAQPALSIDD